MSDDAKLIMVFVIAGAAMFLGSVMGSLTRSDEIRDSCNTWGAWQHFSGVVYDCNARVKP